MAIEFIPALHYSIRWIEKVNNSDIENELKRKLIQEHLYEVINQIELILKNNNKNETSN